MNSGEIDSRYNLEKDNASCSSIYQDENLKSNANPKTEPQAIDQGNKQPTNTFSEVDENTKLQIDCLCSVSVPRNWSHIERLKSQRNKLQEMLSSQTLQDNKNSGKEGNNKGFGTVPNISDSDCLKTNEHSDRSEEDFSNDLDSDSADQLFIVDEEVDANDYTQPLNNVQENLETAVSGSKSADDASYVFEPNKTEVTSSKSMSNFTPFNSNEDLDLCELRVSNINHSLYEAFANTKIKLPGEKKRKILNVKNSTKPKIKSVYMEQCYRTSKPENDIKEVDIDSSDNNCSGKLKPPKEEKEKHLNKSYSDTNVLCEDTGRKKAMRQKLKCFLQGKNKNDLLEKLFIKRMKEGRVCLDSETTLGNGLNGDDAVKSEKVNQQQDESRKLSSNQSNIQESDLVQSQKKESSEMLDQCHKNQSGLDINDTKKSGIFTDTDDESEKNYEGDMEFIQSTRPNLHFTNKSCESLTLQKETCKQVQNLKLEEEYYKMKTKLLQKQSLCNYFKILEKRCGVDKDVLARKRLSYLRKSESCSDMHPCVTDCNYRDSTDDPEKVNDESKNQLKVKEIELGFHTHGSQKNEGKQKQSEKNEHKIMTTLSTKLSSPKTPSRFPNITIIESPKLSSIEVTSPSSIIGKNMKSLLSKKVQQNDGTCEKLEESNKRENKNDMPETIKHQTSSINNERGGLDLNNPLKTCQNITSAKVAYPVAKFPNHTKFLPGQQICLVEQATPQTRYAMIDTNFRPIYRVTKGVFCLPTNPGMPFQSCDAHVSTAPSVVYSGFGIPRPSLQLDNVTSASKPATAILPEQPPVLPVTSHPINVLSTDTALLTTHMKSSLSQGTIPGVMSISNVCQTYKHTSESKRSGHLQKNIAFHSDSPKYATTEIKTKLTKEDESQVAGQKFPPSKHPEAQCKVEMSTWRKVHITDKNLKQSIASVKDHVCHLVNTDEVVIDLDSDSNDSFDSTDLESYQKLKKHVDTSSAYTNCENLSNCVGMKKTNGKTSDENALAISLDSQFESVENSKSNEVAQSNSSIKGNHEGEKAPSLCPLTQDSPHPKKYMKTKFIILKGEICDKWLGVKRKAGFANVPDPNFVQHLLYMEETRQTDANACSKNSLAPDRRDKTSTSGRSGFTETVIPELNEKNLRSDSQKPVKTQDKDALSNTPKITEKKQAVKRPAEKKVCVEGQSGPKKVRYDPPSTTQPQLEKGRYDYLSKSVHKQMMWAVMVFKEWLTSQCEQDCHFESKGPVWLNMKLQQFYKEAHSMDDNTYLVKNLQNVRRFLSLYLEGHPGSNCVNISIPLDPGFSTSNQALADIMRQYKPGLSQETQETQPISPVDLDLLYISNTLSDRNPVCLLSKVWFDISYHLCSSQFSETFLRSLKKHNLTLQSDINGVFYTFTDEICLPPDEMLAKMYATPDVPDRCPVRTTTVYLSKLCENCDLLFQCPRAKWESSEQWYLPVPMTSEKLNGMMTKISTKAKLSMLYKTCNVFATAQRHRNSQ